MAAARSTRVWEVLLEITGVLAAVIAVFQQSDGLKLGVGLIAGLLVAAGITASVRGRLQRRLRLSRRQRKPIDKYFDSVVVDLLKELPLPTPTTAQTFTEKIIGKSAYIPVPYQAFPSSSYQTMPRREIIPRPPDPVELLVGMLDNSQSAVILGDPGSGKTLLAAMTFARMADSYRESHGRSMIPLFIRLSSLHTSPRSDSGSSTMDELIPKPLRRLPSGMLDRLLDAGRACVILDGLDELPTSRLTRSSASRIPDDLAEILGSVTVVTCRVAFHNLYVDTDRVADSLGAEIVLLPLTYSGQVVPFVRQYCQTIGTPTLTDDILEILSQNASLADTLSRPLMLRMTVDVLSFELEQGDERTIQRMLLTGSDFLNAKIYDSYVRSWIKREQRKGPHLNFSPDQKLALIEAIAWQIFCSPLKTDAGYGSFEAVDLTIDRHDLLMTVENWIGRYSDPSLRRLGRSSVIAEIEERTFLIVSQRGDSYRFAHKSFFEFMVAQHVCNELDRSNLPTPELMSLLNMPFPDEIIDFMRELMHWSKEPIESRLRRGNIELSLLNVVRAESRSDLFLMARQQAANLLPIVATAATKQYLRHVGASDNHPFIRRAIAVGEALHDQDSSLLDSFVLSLDEDDRARSFHMGYNRIYYGDQPLSKTNFEDDGGAECNRFFRACIRHLQLERYRYIRTMALATVRLMLQNPSRRARLMAQEIDGLRWIRGVCNDKDYELGAVYDRERLALAAEIDQIFTEFTVADKTTEKGAESVTDQASVQIVRNIAEEGIPADNENFRDFFQPDI